MTSGLPSRFIGTQHARPVALWIRSSASTINFYLFALPAWQIITGWLLTLAVIACVIAVFFIFVTGSTRMLCGATRQYTSRPWRGFSIAFGFFLLILAMRAYIARFERLFDEHTIFGGVTYTDAHVMLPGMLAVCVALVLRCCDCNHQCRGGAARALAGGSSRSSRGLLSRRFKYSAGTSAALS